FQNKSVSVVIGLVRQFLNSITRRQLIIGGGIIGIVVVAGMIACAIAYHKREALLAATLTRVQSRLANEYQIDLDVGNAYFSGLTTVTFENISVVPRGRDQLAGVQALSVSIKLFPLLTGDIRFGQLRGHNAQVQFIKKDSVSNYDFLFRGVDTVQATPAATEDLPDEPAVNLAQAANRMLNNILYKIPEDMDLRDFTLTYSDDSTEQYITVPQADIDNGNLSASVFLNDNEA